MTLLRNNRPPRFGGSNRSTSLHISSMTTLPLLLIFLILFSCASIYITLGLLNKNTSVLQHAEHSMLRPFHQGHEKQFHNQERTTPYPRSVRTTPYPRAVSINGSTVTLTNTQELKTINAKSAKTRTSYDYRDPLYEGECVPMQPWQETVFPTCSTMHELGLYSKARSGEFAHRASGGYNDVFTLEDTMRDNIDPKLAIKILQEGTDYTDRNFDRVRRDGLILERATKSKYVVDIYGFCGFLVLVPFAEGNLPKAMRKNSLTPLKKLQYAYEVAAGLAAVHDIDGEKLSAVTQGDLKADQYLLMDGVLKLGDFNRGRFLRRNSTAPDTACPYTIGVNDGAYRSPEEYKYLPETSAIDVWALGSLIYQILHGYEVWDDIETNEEAQKKVMDGELPEIGAKYKESNDPAIKAVLDAIDMCYVYDPEERAKAWDVSSFLEKKLNEIENAKTVEQ